MNNFKYYHPRENFDNYPLACEILARYKLVVDTRFLPVMEAAENGNCTAWLELQNAFAYGQNGIPQNYKMARYYTDIMLFETTACPVLNQTPKLYFEALRASAYLEYNYSNYDKAMLEFVELVKFMVANIPFENWDFQIFDTLNCIKSLLANEALN